MISALADEHVLSALVHALRRRGMDVATVQDRGLRKTEDPELLSLSMQEQRLLLTNDTDFLALANDLAKRAEPLRQSCFGPSSEEPFGICYRVLFPWRAKRTTREYVLECTTSSRGQSLRWRRVEKALDWLSPFVISNSWFPVTNPSSPNPRISTNKFRTFCNPFATVGGCLSWTTGNDTNGR